uniref:Uncharacterized protein n=1 Tax=Acrobeloides nanus TaxID=290746 RepID=A0A914DJT2_9BILA
MNYIDAKIDLNKPYETLKLTIPGYQTETFNLFHAFHALISVFKLEIPFVISDLLHLVKKPIFYKGLLVMKINGNLILLRPTIQSLYVDLQHLMMLTRKSKRSIIEKEFWSRCYHQTTADVVSQAWSHPTHLFRLYALRRLREKINEYITNEFIHDELNNNKGVGLLHCRRWKRTLNSRSISISKKRSIPSSLSYISLERSLEKFECEKSPTSMARIFQSKEIPNQNYAWFEISCDGEVFPSDEDRLLVTGDNLFGCSTKFMCFIITAQSACKRLPCDWLPPDLTLDIANFNIRIDKDDDDQHWMYSLNSKFRAISPNAKLFIGKESLLSDYTLSLAYMTIKNGCSSLRVSMPKDGNLTILPYWLQDLLQRRRRKLSI